MFTVYILYSAQLDKYYIGSTSNLEKRVKKHNTDHAGYTGGVLDWKVVYTETYDTKFKTLVREKEIKNWKSRKMIEKLIA
jgi:putative endonuclease